MAFDAHKNFAYAHVSVAPSPATSGTTFSTTNSEAALLDDPSSGAYNATIWAANQLPLSTNAEIVRITAKGAADSGGAGHTQFTISRTQESTSARSIQVGDQIAVSITRKVIKDIEDAITQKTFLTVGTSAGADYVCDGTNDNVELQAAIDAINTAGGGTVFIRKGTYNVTTPITIGSNTTLWGEEAKTTIIKKVAAQNNTVFNNKDTTNGNSFIVIRNLTIDQNGDNQSSAGGGSSFTGLYDSTLENVIFEKSYTFNLFIGSTTGTLLTGTLTFTNGDTTVTGSGTAFTTELAVGTIVKSNGAHFQRVQSITNDTSFELDRAWGWATESGVTARKVNANARNRILNCTFNGNDHNDNVGLGLFDDSLIQGCISRNATAGYGFGPDHTNRLKFVSNTSYNNSNSGIGMETCGNCVVSNNVFYGNGNGVYLLSGAYRNVVSNNQCRQNSNGIHVTYNSTSFPKPEENTIIGNSCELNLTHGIRVGGANKTIISNNRCFNNANAGIALATDNSIAPNDTLIEGNQCYDNQDTKTQQRGIWIAAGTNTRVVNNIATNADHTTAGITDSGTNTSFEMLWSTTSITSSATPTPIGSAKHNELFVTALAVDATIAAPTGTATNGNRLIIRIKDNGTARALAYNSIFRWVGPSPQTTTVLGKTLYLGVIYNSADTKWDIISVSLEA